MIQIQTELTVADNTGAKRAECTKVLGGSKRSYPHAGDLILISVTHETQTAKPKQGAAHKPRAARNINTRPRHAPTQKEQQDKTHTQNKTQHTHRANTPKAHTQKKHTKNTKHTHTKKTHNTHKAHTH